MQGDLGVAAGAVRMCGVDMDVGYPLYVAASPMPEVFGLQAHQRLPVVLEGRGRGDHLMPRYRLVNGVGSATGVFDDRDEDLEI